MDCLKCGTWNPDDKLVCWRCQTELPKPVEKKKKKPVFLLGLPIWSWILIIFMLVAVFAAQCLGPMLVGSG